MYFRLHSKIKTNLHFYNILSGPSLVQEPLQPTSGAFAGLSNHVQTSAQHSQLCLQEPAAQYVVGFR